MNCRSLAVRTDLFQFLLNDTVNIRQRQILGSIIVCIGPVATLDAAELCLGWPVFLLDTAAFRTALGRKLWIDLTDLDTILVCLIFNFSLGFYTRA